MRPSGFLLGVMLCVAACGGTAQLPSGPTEPPAPPATNDPGFALSGLREWYLIGNGATPGDDTLHLHVDAPAGTATIDAWIGDGAGTRLVETIGGGFDLTADLAALPAGVYPLLLAADGADVAFARVTFQRSAPFYVLVSTDWDFADPGDSMLAIQDTFHAEHPQLQITHFVGPYTFTDPAVTAERQARIASWLLAQQSQHGDEIGLHIHPYCHFVADAGLPCVTDQSTVYATDTTGYTIKLEAYARSQMVTLMNHANDLFAAHGLPRARSFCGGGWTSTLDTVKAAQEAGFTTEASAFNWSRIEEWKNVGTGELYRWLMAHWAPMNDRSQPYYPRDSDVLADAAPHLAILEVPHNGLTVDYVNSAELEYLFAANWDGAPLAAPRTLQVGYHPAADFGHGYVVRLDGFLDLVDAHLAVRGAGPVVYTTMSALVPAFPRP